MAKHGAHHSHKGYPEGGIYSKLDNQRSASTSGHHRHNSSSGHTSSQGHSYESNYVTGYGNGYDNNHTSGNRHHSKRKKKGPKIVLALVLLVLVVGIGAFAYQGVSLANQAKSISSSASTIISSISSGDYAKAQTEAKNLSTTAREVSNTLGQPQWKVLSYVPVVGNDVTTLKSMTGTVADLSDQVLTPLTSSLASLSSGPIVSKGKINTTAVKQLVSAIGTTAPAMQTCTDSLSNLPEISISMINQVTSPAIQKIVSLNEAFQQVVKFQPALSQMFDGDAHTYLVVATNVAEMRACGGFPGSLGALTIGADGSIELGDFGTPYDLLDESMGSYASEFNSTMFIRNSAWYGDSYDAGFDPNYPLVAQIWSSAYERKQGTSVDGVLSITPSMVQKILAVTGGITLSDGTTVDGTNATKVLQHDIYWKYLSTSTSKENKDLTDKLFAETADKAFSKLMDNLNGTSLLGFAQCLNEGMSDREVLLWFKDSAAEAGIANETCSGALNSDSSTPVLGVFMNIYMGSKLGWFAGINTTIGSSTKNADGTVTYSVKTTFSNTATKAEIEEGSSSLIIGDGGEMLPGFYLYAPAGGSISDVSASDGSQLTETYINGRQVYWEYGQLPPSSTVTVTYSVTVAANTTQSLTTISNPTLEAYRK